MKVYLVGAGPGDPDLCTVRGMKLLGMADVILYDYLVNPSLLKYAKLGARLICVGKRAGSHSASQEEINTLLMKWYTLGMNVLRLKSGDPFIFGRGGEEMEFLCKTGIPFEVVPGVSSAIAAPAYAGIPLTHRNLSSSVTILTGHEVSKKCSSYNWKALVGLGGTLLFLMGMQNLSEICCRLKEEGLPIDTPAAIVQWGTTAKHRKLIATLENIDIKAKEENFTAPAIFILGNVAVLGKNKTWFEEKPLLGKRIVVTRAREQAGDLSNLLEEQGAEIFEFPCIAISPVQDSAAVLDAVAALEQYNWLIFTSANAVDQFFYWLRQAGKDSRALGHSKLAVIGPGTADALSRYGLRYDFMPSVFVAEELADSLLFYLQGKGANLNCQKILIPRAAETRDVLEQKLSSKGVQVKVLPVYKTVLPEEDDFWLEKKEYLFDLFAQNRIDCVSFASSSAVNNFFRYFPAEIFSEMKICWACIGPVTAMTLQKHGITNIIQPSQYTVKDLSSKIVAFFESTKN